IFPNKVLIIVGDCEKFAAKDPRVRTFKCSEDLTKLDPTKIDHLMKFWFDNCDAILSNPEIMNRVKSSDAVIGDAAFQCSYLIADKFSLPHVTVLMSPLSTGSVLQLNFAQLPSYIPQFTSGFTDHMNFLQRVKNTMQHLFHQLMVLPKIDNVYGPLKKKHNITPEKSLRETYQKIDLVLVQSDPLDYPRFHLPNTKLVGPLLSSPAKPLPGDLQQFVMGSGDEGVILVSFGSILSQIDDQTIERMAAVFSSLPQRVIWKLDTEGKSLHLGDNVKVSSWLPQNDILGHPKTRLFIGHAGMNGMLEAAYHGVPMICVPFFGDQFDNSVAAKHFGMAEFLYKESITEGSLVKLINTVLNKPSYRENAVRISRSIKLRPRSAIEAAADWVEYAQALGDLSFLRPRSLDLPFYQLYLLDVLALFLLLSIIIVAAVYILRYLMTAKTIKTGPHFIASLTVFFPYKVLIVVGERETYAAKDPRVLTFSSPDDINKLDVTKIDDLMKLWLYNCDAILSNPDVMNQIKSSDAVIGDALFLCSFLIADKFSLPHVTVLMSPLSSGSILPLNFENLPSYQPQFTSGFTDHMNFLQRVKNTALCLIQTIAPFNIDGVYETLKKKHNITPEKTLQETYQKVDLILVQSGPLDYPRPLLPNTKLVGPLLSSPPKPLPDDLQRFVMGSGEEGVILVSFGSILSEIDDRTIERMAAVFSNLPQRVVWKLDTEGKSLHLGDNVKVSSWLPQNDILGHPKTRLFIGHAGMNGMLEAAYHGVPMICVPFFADQFDNSVAAKHFGMAEILHKESITEESLVTLISTVLNNPSYRENAARISKSIKLRPRSAIEEAAEWVEYAQAQGDLSFLRPRSLDLPFYQLYLMDVFTLFIFLLIIVVTAVYLLLRCSYRLCLRKKLIKEKSF
ncbi:unnamed protein product, partial [Pocillopora meandrina]